MAFTKLAIVSGEWQLDPDQVFRLYVRPTLTILNRAGVTHYVSAFATTARRTTDSLDTTSHSFVCSASAPSSAFGGTSGSDYSASNSQWLEPIVQSHNFHMLGELSHDSSPIMAGLLIRDTVTWKALDMQSGLICIDDTEATNQFDEQLIEILKRFKVG